MSERPHYNSPSATSPSAEENAEAFGERHHNVYGEGYPKDFGQRHIQRPLVALPQPHELTAEWTVRAQLTFARAGEKVRREFSSNDPLNPVRVVYKWSTLDATATSVDNDDDGDGDGDDDVDTASTLRRATSSHCSSQSTPQKRASSATPRRHQSFRSTSSSVNAPTNTVGAEAGETGGDSAFSSVPTPPSSSFKQHSSNAPSGSGMATAALYGTRCRSTCNIVVSAVADFLPPGATTSNTNDGFVPTTRTTTASDFLPEMEPDPFVYNTTASYTVLPQKSLDDNSTTATTKKNFTAFGKVLALRDAFSQTSDTEIRFPDHHDPHDTNRLHQSRSQLGYQRRPYDHRSSTTEGLVQPKIGSDTLRRSNEDVEGNAYKPSPSTFKSASMSRIPSLLQRQTHPQQSGSKVGSTEQQKKPRTVHIDVYCTGSEDDENADAEASSSSDDDSNRHEVDSNSTPQTVLDNEVMRLRHKRITGQALPRRLAKNQQQQPQQQQKQKQSQQSLSSQSDLNLGHAITKSNTAEEVSESKQLLFRKHIGDQRAAKLATLRQKYLRQPSDDALSSTYPNSSHSTVRDATCSSIASTVLSQQGQHEPGDSSWKETEETDDYNSIAKSDSFDYANSVDRMRIRQMEKFWSRDEDPRLHESSQPYNQRGQVSSHSPTKPHYLQTISEVNTQPSSPYRPSATAKFFQGQDTITSDLDTFSESDVFYSNVGRSPNSAGFRPYQRQLSQPITHVTQTPSPSPPKAMKPKSPLLQQTSHFPRNRPGFLQFFGPHTVTGDSPQTTPTSPIQPSTETTQLQAPNLLYPNFQPNLHRWKSETRDNLSSSTTPAFSEQSQQPSPQPVSSTYSPSPQRCGSEIPPETTSASTFQVSPAVARRFEMHRDSPSVSEVSTVVSGYTPEYLEKARKFGKVVSTVRKPGHHVGPTKNPNCSCESCQRWMAERFQLRGRAFSLGERPILKRPTRD